jgi:hypothetical protein
VPQSAEQRLIAAVDSLYLTFARFPYRASMPACAHCVTDDDLLGLGHSAVRDLPADLLGRYVRKAVSTWGEVDDFKRVLPRLLELVAADDLRVPPTIVMAKLRRAEWRNWPADEQRATWQFLLAWWHFDLSRWVGPGLAAHRILDAISVAEADLGPYFSNWHHLLAGETDGRLPAVQHLVELLIDSPLRPDDPATIGRLAPEALGNAVKQYREFLLDPVTAEELERALADFAHSEHARRLAVAFARLRRLADAIARAER